jgi:hypothetical protein
MIMKIKYHIVLPTIIFFIVKSAECSSLLLKEPEAKLSPWACVATAALVIPAGIIMINNHEIGHTVFARAAGDRNSHYSLLKRENYFDYTKLSRYGNAVVPMGGVIFSELMAEGCALLNGNVNMPNWIHRFLSVLYLVAKCDLILQTEQLWENSYFYKDMKRTGAPGNSDFVDFSFYMANGNKTGFNWLKAGLTTIPIIDVYFSWNKIKINWAVITGKKEYKHE